jgi:hypothetical protein
LLVVLSFVGLAIFNLNNGKDIPIVNQPDIEEFVVSRIQAVTSLLELTYDTISNPFDGKQHLFNKTYQAFVCPEERNGLQTIVSCVFLHADFAIHNILQAIPSYGKYIFTAFGATVDEWLPGHFVVEDALNSIYSIIQRFAPLFKPTYIKPQNTGNIDRNSTTTSEDLSRASFSFEPFTDDVVEVKEACESQCSLQTSDAAAFMYDEVTEISTIPSPMTRIDYIFEFLGEENFYICQYSESENFGGTWIFFIESCLCGGATCQASPLYFGLFSGCADLLNRIGIPCSSEEPCTIDRLCPYPDTKIILKATDNKEVLAKFLTEACLDICSSLAGFSTFETVVALGAMGSSLSTNALGLSGNAFGGPLGVPAALLPGIIEHTAIFISNSYEVLRILNRMFLTYI